MIRYIIAFWASQIIKLILKLFRKNATQLPGKIAITICPDFLGRIKRPSKVIAITGTNGKTTTTNLIIRVLEENGYKTVNNSLGSNTHHGIASALINDRKGDVAVFEVDERCSKYIYKYIEPTYLVCTNLFRDSIKRNAHTEFIVSQVEPAIPKNTTLILNADDLISSRLSEDNKKIFFGIGELKEDSKGCSNIVCDIRVCPICKTELKYNYLHYHHIGQAYCPNCDFKSYKPDVLATGINYEGKAVIINNKQYHLFADSLFNIYNMLAVVAVLKEFGLEEEKVQKSFENMEIVKTRFNEEQIGNLKVISQLSKGQNPVACTQNISFVANEKGEKVVILILGDLHDEEHSSENMTWLYDIDFEFLNKEDIKQIIVGGKRAYDIELRLLLADIEKEKIILSEDYKNISESIILENTEKIFILHDLYACELAEEIKRKLGERV